MRRRFGVEPAAQIPRQQAVHRVGEFVGAERRRARSCRRAAARAIRRRRGGERRVGQVGPFVAFGAGAGTSRGRAIAASALRPRQAVEAEPRDAFGQHARGLVVRLDLADGCSAARSRRAGAARRAAQAARSRRRTRSRRGSRCGRRNAPRSRRASDRRRQQDAALRGGAGDLADREKRLARQRRRRIDVGAAAVGEQERAARAAALGDAVGIGEREERAGATAPRRSRCAAVPAPAISAQRFAMRARVLARGASGRGASRRADG